MSNAGEGSIQTKVLREILKELDDKLTPEELDGIIEEVDADGSGTVDFDGALKLFLKSGADPGTLVAQCAPLS